MRLVTFANDGRTRIGVCPRGEDVVIDLAEAASELPLDMTALVHLAPEVLDRVAEAVANAPSRVPLSDITVLAPFPRPARNIFCVGKNYHEHAWEFHASGFDATAGKVAIPDVPVIFTKTPSSVTGPDTTIPAHLDPTHSVDYEGELAVVIGPGGRGISKTGAMDHVFGYTIINDVTARDLQRRHKQWFLGKSIDGFCPMGPVLVTADEVRDVGALRLVTRINGEVRQDALVADLIFDIPTLIETISASITLEPGDIIATGTPAGVGIGFDPPRYLHPGDEVAITIEPIGELRNTVN